MDIKDLNKPQLILLAILLSFVTSIATGITTVTLMQQAPSSVTVPINRVVRQTVEKIVPAEGKNTVQTVVIKEEDLVVDAIAKNESAIFIITKDGFDLEGKASEVSAGEGFVISDAGIIVADTSLILGEKNLYIKNSSGKFKASFISSNEKGFTFLKIGEAVNGEDKIAYVAPTFGNLGEMKMGQKILVLGNTVSSFMFDGNKDMKINVSKSNAGGLVLNLDGEVLGIALSNEITFASIDLITEALKTIETKTL